MASTDKPQLRVVEGKEWEAPRSFTLTVMQDRLDDDTVAEWRPELGILVVRESASQQAQLWAIEEMCRLIWTGRSDIAKPDRPAVRAL
jgi:hypothetical protein